MTIYKGGYTPSIMGSLLVSGPMLLGLTFLQGKKLVQNESQRMKSRNRVSKRHVRKRRISRKNHFRR